MEINAAIESLTSITDLDPTAVCDDHPNIYLRATMDGALGVMSHIKPVLSETVTTALEDDTVVSSRYAIVTAPPLYKIVEQPYTDADKGYLRGLRTPEACIMYMHYINKIISHAPANPLVRDAVQSMNLNLRLHRDMILGSYSVDDIYMRLDPVAPQIVLGGALYRILHSRNALYPKCAVGVVGPFNQWVDTAQPAGPCAIQEVNDILNVAREYELPQRVVADLLIEWVLETSGPIPRGTRNRITLELQKALATHLPAGLFHDIVIIGLGIGLPPRAVSGLEEKMGIDLFWKTQNSYHGRDSVSFRGALENAAVRDCSVITSATGKTAPITTFGLVTVRTNPPFPKLSKLITYAPHPPITRSPFICARVRDVYDQEAEVPHGRPSVPRHFSSRMVVLRERAASVPVLTNTLHEHSFSRGYFIPIFLREYKSIYAFWSTLGLPSRSHPLYIFHVLSRSNIHTLETVPDPVPFHPKERVFMGQCLAFYVRETGEELCALKIFRLVMERGVLPMYARGDSAPVQILGFIVNICAALLAFNDTDGLDSLDMDTYEELSAMGRVIWYVWLLTTVFPLYMTTATEPDFLDPMFEGTYRLGEWNYVTTTGALYPGDNIERLSVSVDYSALDEKTKGFGETLNIPVHVIGIVNQFIFPILSAQLPYAFRRLPNKSVVRHPIDMIEAVRRKLSERFGSCVNPPYVGPITPSASVPTGKYIHVMKHPEAYPEYTARASTETDGDSSSDDSDDESTEPTPASWIGDRDEKARLEARLREMEATVRNDLLIGGRLNHTGPPVIRPPVPRAFPHVDASLMAEAEKRSGDMLKRLDDVYNLVNRTTHMVETGDIFPAVDPETLPPPTDLLPTSGDSESRSPAPGADPLSHDFDGPDPPPASYERMGPPLNPPPPPPGAPAVDPLPMAYEDPVSPVDPPPASYERMGPPLNPPPPPPGAPASPVDPLPMAYEDPVSPVDPPPAIYDDLGLPLDPPPAVYEELDLPPAVYDEQDLPLDPPPAVYDEQDLPLDPPPAVYDEQDLPLDPPPAVYDEQDLPLDPPPAVHEEPDLPLDPPPAVYDERAPWAESSEGSPGVTGVDESPPVASPPETMGDPGGESATGTTGVRGFKSERLILPRKIMSNIPRPNDALKERLSTRRSQMYDWSSDSGSDSSEYDNSDSDDDRTERATSSTLDDEVERMTQSFNEWVRISTDPIATIPDIPPAPEPPGDSIGSPGESVAEEAQPSTEPGGDHTRAPQVADLKGAELDRYLYKESESLISVIDELFTEYVLAPTAPPSGPVVTPPAVANGGTRETRPRESCPYTVAEKYQILYTYGDQDELAALVESTGAGTDVERRVSARVLANVPVSSAVIINESLEEDQFTRLENMLYSMGLKRVYIPGDGNCLYNTLRFISGADGESVTDFKKGLLDDIRKYIRNQNPVERDMLLAEIDTLAGPNVYGSGDLISFFQLLRGIGVTIVSWDKIGGRLVKLVATNQEGIPPEYIILFTNSHYEPLVTEDTKIPDSYLKDFIEWKRSVFLSAII
ncbi:ORF65 [Ictalurid herpesvirus 1]|nr:ORF65 [Ictalurid herpesvirus 1]